MNRETQRCTVGPQQPDAASQDRERVDRQRELNSDPARCLMDHNLATWVDLALLLRHLRRHALQRVAERPLFARRYAVWRHRVRVRTPAIDAAGAHLRAIQIQIRFGMPLHLEGLTSAL